MAERTALNFLQRMSGIATLTSKFVDAVSGTGSRNPRHAQDCAGASRPGQVRGVCRRGDEITGGTWVTEC